MCKKSLRFEEQAEVQMGMSLVARNIPMKVFRHTLGFGSTNPNDDPNVGICIRTGWGLMFKLSREQLLGLKLPGSLGDESGATIFARFSEGTVDYHNVVGTEDRFHFEIGNNEIVTVNFDCKEFFGLRAEVVARPDEKWPPDAINRVTHRTQAKVPLRTTTAQVLAG